jgi:glycosyltransferase involved in cell wall biosynthesis
MSLDLAVVIPAHNPRQEYLSRVLDALRSQTLEFGRWELLLVDNASDRALRDIYDLSWHPNAIHVHETSARLALARLAGIGRSRAGIIVFVDDDNVLAANYLEQVLTVATEFPFMGTWSGQVEPEFERPDLAPARALYDFLACRDVPVDIWSNDPNHHASTPWGVGLCVRREVAEAHSRELRDNPARALLDPQGRTMLYGGDTDIAYTGCRMGLGKGVFSRLRVTHLIPAARCTASHLCRVAHGKGYSEVLHGYVMSGMLPAPDGSSLSRAVRHIRMVLKPRLQRSIAFAYQRGRRQAFQHLAAGQVSQ